MSRKAKIYIDLETALATFDRSDHSKITRSACCIYLKGYQHGARVRRKNSETFAEMIIRAATKALENEANSVQRYKKCEGCGARRVLRKYKGFEVCVNCARGMKEITVQ